MLVSQSPPCDVGMFWDFGASTKLPPPLPSPPLPRCSLLADPDNLDALRWGPEGFVGASVPVEWFAPLGELHPLVGTDGLAQSRRSPLTSRGSSALGLAAARALFSHGEKCENLRNPHLQHQQMRPNPAEMSTICSTVCSGKSAICSTVRSEMRLPEECVAVVLFPGREP